MSATARSYEAWVRSEEIDLSSVRSEEDVKIKLLVPYMKTLGYEPATLRYNNTIPVQIGTRSFSVFSDVDVPVGNRTALVIDTKNARHPIQPRDLLQAESYAKLVSTPPAPFAAVFNGTHAVVRSIADGAESDRLPTLTEVKARLSKQRSFKLREPQLDEVRRVLYTIQERDSLSRILKDCKETLVSAEGIRSDKSFQIISSFLIIKMAEERRSQHGQANRFTVDYIIGEATRTGRQVSELIAQLYQLATEQFPGLPDATPKPLRHASSYTHLIESLEPWSFTGTGADIKGEVYEVFLSHALRGDRGQFFTPREVVDYMVDVTRPSDRSVVLDPSCGSGGFLIRCFERASRLIRTESTTDAERQKRMGHLTERKLWGIEIDEDLASLARINLIMHGDGWNHIENLDGLSSEARSITERMKREAGQAGADVVLTNPPFSLPVDERTVLDTFVLGREHDAQEIDVLFVERCLDLAMPGGTIAIVLPEGFINSPSKQYLRDFIQARAAVTSVVSLPAGAFMPFGASRSQTCLLFLRKNGAGSAPKHIFLAETACIGYECDKKILRPREENDLPLFLREAERVSEGVHTTPFGGRSLWVRRKDLRNDRWDARAHFKMHAADLADHGGATMQPLGEVAIILDGTKVSPARSGGEVRYIALPEIGEITGIIPRIARVRGDQIGSDKIVFSPGDILFSKLYPSRGRIVLIPDDAESGVCSTEMCIIHPKANGPLDRYALLASLRSKSVLLQCKDATRGSSSSRPRIHRTDLEKIMVPVPSVEDAATISGRVREAVTALWKAHDLYFGAHREALALLGETTALEERWDAMALEGKSKRKGIKKPPRATLDEDRHDVEIASARLDEIRHDPKALVRGEKLARALRNLGHDA